jgi:D-alanyl-D-alanine carboxypeptidase
VVLQLAAEGRLGLDDPASRYVRGTPGLDGVTIRQLLDHTSGLPDYSAVQEGFGPGLLRDRDRRWTAGELLTISSSVQRDFPPGSAYAYSNSNYVALGLVVESVTGTTWAAQVRTRIIDPLHLDATYVAGAERGPAVTAGYGDGDNDGDVENLENGREWTSLASSEGPAGALVSTAGDLATFADALFHGRLVDGSALRDMTTPTRHHPRASGYGLGVEITRPDWTTTVWGHGGFLPGFRSTMWYVPSVDRVVVVLTNDSRGDTADLAELLLHGRT